ncbi:hypothetical protein J437_LFUL008796 [Ladona fulva]|uniref:Peptidoglycan recognition protein family domain-containing protein n=1 Tax=Ladona fulva TaxID=123851 RepID=A0A8K0KCC7_LADFU|nr:hypothetical protein J437_LFUL008796 [Ladona fulva]
MPYNNYPEIHPLKNDKSNLHGLTYDYFLYLSADIPNDGMVNAVQGLINYGISIGKISANYTLLGHRQLIRSKCPGDALFDLMKNWPHWGQPDADVLTQMVLDFGEEIEDIHSMTLPSFPVILRREWGAKPSKSPLQQMQEVPVPFVIIHDTPIFKSCSSMNQCKERMREIQQNYQEDHKSDDIDYSFCIGSNGITMEARGWDLMTNHTPGYYGRSIEIALLGNFKTTAPNTSMVNAVQGLINYGITIGKISPNYTLLAHRQLHGSNCPGDALFNLMKRWPHWGQPEGSAKTGIKRIEWGAKPPKSPPEQMQEVPVPFVILHDTFIPKSCHSMNNCKETMRELQRNHQDDRGYKDIAYSFCIGHKGLIMEGRGWDLSSGGTPGYDQKSIAIAIIGDYSSKCITPYHFKMNHC